MKCLFIAVLCLVAGAPGMRACADEPLTVRVVKKGAEKHSVSLAGLKVSGPQAQVFYTTLSRNLELSGWFRVSSRGAVRVMGTASGTGTTLTVRARVNWTGTPINVNFTVNGRREARVEAQKLVDQLVSTIAGERGIAQSKIVCVNRRGKNNADLYVCDADGQGMIQLTQDSVAAVGPRWAPNGHDIYYTSFLKDYPRVFRVSLDGARSSLARFKGLNTGAAISPDGSQCALILSYQGNPELYVLTLSTGSLTRMTNTPYGSEASPCWSPDGRQIVFVSDLGKRPNLYIVDVATRKSRRITFRGTENVNPDWSHNNKIVYATKREGSYRIAVMDARKGEASCEMVTDAGDYEHPSWAPDGRHIVCSSRSTLYLLDTLGDPAVRLFNVAGKWMSPDWSDSINSKGVQ